MKNNITLMSSTKIARLFFTKGNVSTFRDFNSTGTFSLTGDMKLKSVILAPDFEVSITFGIMGQTGEKTYFTNWDHTNGTSNFSTIMLSGVQSRNFPYIITLNKV